MLYTCLSAKGFDNCLKQLGENKFAELRLDLTEFDSDQLSEFMKKQVSFIVTCRPGVFTESKRILLLKQAIKEGADYIDIETESDDETISELRKACEGTKCKLIISYHNFNDTPTVLEFDNIIKKCKDQGADIVKLASKVNSKADNAIILSLYSRYNNLVAFGMGADGAITRIASIYCGAPFTYVASNDGCSTAPGQFTLDKILQLINILKHTS